MSFEELYQQHKNMVYNLALHYAQNIEDAQEITQDVFVAAYQGLDSFEGNAATSTWLYRITVNKSLDFLKAKKRRKRWAFFTSLFVEGSGALQHNPPEHNHPGIQMEQKEAVANLLRHINALPDKQRTALILQKIEQKSQVEIADIMKISPKAVESLVQRAKATLMKKLGG